MSTPGRSPVGRYELRERLGAGGMGTVWRAWDPSLQRDVAVKEVLLPEDMDPEARAEARARTLREAQATARISDMSVVTVHDVLEHGDSPWIVMELLSGVSLQHRLDRHGPMPVERVEEAARSLLSGLRAAHAAGVTHRDVKPANIMLTDDGRTVLTDFGIANVDGSTALTQTGVYIGSPEYMAPERFEGERALPASDLWSLGVTLYALVEGRSPFKRDTITGIISAVLTAPVPPRLSSEGRSRSPESAPLRALIGALLDRDVSTRPGPEEALALLERERHGRERGGGAPGTGPRGALGPVPGTAPGTGPQRAVEGAAPVPNVPGGHRPGLRTPHSSTPYPNAPGSVPRQPPYGPGTMPSGPHTAAAWGGMTGYPPPGPATGRAPLPGRPGGGAGHPGAFGPAGHGVVTADGRGPWRRGRPAMPASVVTAAMMLGLNAVYLLVLAVMFAGAAALDGSGDTGWGPPAALGLWGLFSAAAALGVMTRSRLLYGAVVLVQIVMSVVLVFSMFSVFIYTPEQLPFYVLMLVFNLVIAGLLLVPSRARAFFGFGSDLG
ncbi:serine/threonine-protein kinase [Nocardiopsis quinghaiensis]|uniref:serine/threonine-protein kinase n=1 Tax=Nocardiopsis quinghaiensis TaxID=464995 RepID=UPI001239A7DE|nr:serine/threonine-protein kinase [Nocardiopsis quinghaiensis]